MLSHQEKKELRILLIVVGGFLTGLALLFFLIATDT
jgi:hypothetical protein